MGGLARLLIIVGVMLVVAGLLLSFAGRIPWLGRLPGDFTFRRDGFTLYVPLATSLLISLLLSLLLQIFRR